MSEELSAREQILHHIELVDCLSAAGIEPPAEWQRLRRRFELFDNAVQHMQRSDDK